MEEEPVRPRGRPRKYATEEDRRVAQAAKARERYSRNRDIISMQRKRRYREKKAEASAQDDHADIEPTVH